MANITVPLSAKASSTRAMPTATKSTGASGASKLAAFRAAQATKESAIETPEEYREEAIAEAKKKKEAAAAMVTPTVKPTTKIVGAEYESSLLKTAIEAAKAKTVTPTVQISKAKEISVPSPVSPAYAERYAQIQKATGTTEFKKQLTKLEADAAKPKTAAELRAEMVQSQIMQTEVRPISTPTKLEELKAAKATELAKAMQLGQLEPHTERYEKYVAGRVEPWVSLEAPVYAQFIGGISEAVAYTPVALPRMIVGLTRAPAETVEAAITGPIETTIAQPARGAGQIAGMVTVGKAAPKVVPRLKTLQLVEIERAGAAPVYKPIEYGKALTVGETPIISAAGKRIGLGVVAPEAELLTGRTVTAFGKLETKAFEAAVKEALPAREAEYFRAGREITERVYKAKEPVVKPTEFKIESEHIPEIAKPVVETAIKEYPGEIKVFGSAVQKQQLGEFMARMPRDIEVVVDMPSRFVEAVESKLKSAGIEYAVKGTAEAPKIYFGEMKGIEIFAEKPYEGMLAEGYRPAKPIAFGYEPLKPYVVEGVKTTPLMEQAARKYAGATTIKETAIEPVHIGRLKDIPDVLSIGTGYAVKKGLPIEKQLVTYAKIAREKYPGLLEESPITKFVAEKGRLPTSAEIKKLGGIRVEAPELLYERVSIPEKTMEYYASMAAREMKTAYPTYAYGAAYKPLAKKYGYPSEITTRKIKTIEYPSVTPTKKRVQIASTLGIGKISKPYAAPTIQKPSREISISTISQPPSEQVSISPYTVPSAAPSAPMYVSPYPPSGGGIGGGGIIPPIEIPLPFDKKKRKFTVKKKPKAMGFEEFIVNPIASPFRSFGKIGKMK